MSEDYNGDYGYQQAYNDAYQNLMGAVNEQTTNTVPSYTDNSNQQQEIYNNLMQQVNQAQATTMDQYTNQFAQYYPSSSAPTIPEQIPQYSVDQTQYVQPTTTTSSAAYGDQMQDIAQAEQFRHNIAMSFLRNGYYAPDGYGYSNNYSGTSGKF